MVPFWRHSCHLSWMMLCHVTPICQQPRFPASLHVCHWSVPVGTPTKPHILTFCALFDYAQELFCAVALRPCHVTSSCVCCWTTAVVEGNADHRLFNRIGQVAELWMRPCFIASLLIYRMCSVKSVPSSANCMSVIGPCMEAGFIML